MRYSPFVSDWRFCLLKSSEVAPSDGLEELVHKTNAEKSQIETPPEQGGEQPNVSQFVHATECRCGVCGGES